VEKLAAKALVTLVVVPSQKLNNIGD